ncbi:MAG: hypothetical protein ABIC95_03320 [archaeon]
MEQKPTKGKEIEELIKEVESNKRLNTSTGQVMRRYPGFVEDMMTSFGEYATIAGISTAYDELEFPSFQDIMVMIKAERMRAE